MFIGQIDMRGDYVSLNPFTYILMPDTWFAQWGAALSKILYRSDGSGCVVARRLFYIALDRSLVGEFI